MNIYIRNTLQEINENYTRKYQVELISMWGYTDVEILK